MFIPFLFILFVVSLSLIQLSYSVENNWKEINVDSRLDNQTKYIFYYNSEGIELIDVQYFTDFPSPGFVFNTTQVIDKQAQIKAPRNYPVDSHQEWIIVTDISGSYEYEESDCFYTYTISTINSKVLDFGYYTVLAADLDEVEILQIPDYCLPHTIANYPQSMKTYENIRGEQVNVYLSSVLKLLERNYLVEAIN